WQTPTSSSNARGRCGAAGLDRPQDETLLSRAGARSKEVRIAPWANGADSCYFRWASRSSPWASPWTRRESGTRCGWRRKPSGSARRTRRSRPTTRDCGRSCATWRTTPRPSSASRGKSSASFCPTRSFSSWRRKVPPGLHRWRRRLRRVFPPLLGAVVLSGLFSGQYASLERLRLGWSLVLAALALVAGVLWFAMVDRRMREPERSAWLELEVGGLMLVAAFALIDPHGRSGNPLHPLIYLLMAFLTTPSSYRVALGLAGLAIFVESALFFLRGTSLGYWYHLVARIFFLLAFAFLPKLALAIESTSMRISGQQELRRRERARREDARRFRL